ncbi:MAG: peptidoglycan editing factor PgeF [Caldisericaceae bacterium]|nr:peptidoglycan editing factor PgeF [Caldisericaceae bacterium]
MLPEPVIKKFQLFNEFRELLHGFSTRQGGFSKAPFDELNLGLSTPDDPQVVKRNRQLFFKELKLPNNYLVFPQQTHSANVQIVNKPGIVSNCDALITNQKNLFLTVQTADCFPVFIFDPLKKVVALVHSGWRGTAQNIVGRTIKKMEKNFGCKAVDLLVAIGPGVQQTCYQVDEKTANYFQQRFLQPDGPGHFKLDVQSKIIAQLKECRVPESQIEWDSQCTHCAKEAYYSYRRDGLNSGRMMGIIGIVGA